MTLSSSNSLSVVPSLPQLAETANRAHQAALEAGATLLESALIAGEALMQARKQCAAGQWRTWLAENFEASTFTATCYLRIAHQREAVEQSGETTITGAVAYLRDAGLPGPFEAGGWNAGDHSGVEDEIKRLHTEGRHSREIARMVGVSRNVVRRLVDPGYLASERSRTRRKQPRSTGEPTLSNARVSLTDLTELLRTIIRADSNPEVKGAVANALRRLALADEDLLIAAQITGDEQDDQPRWAA